VNATEWCLLRRQQLNEVNTELIGSTIRKSRANSWKRADSNRVKLLNSASRLQTFCDLGIDLDSELAMKSSVQARQQLFPPVASRRLRQVRHLGHEGTAQLLMSAFIGLLSWLNYCNSILAGRRAATYPYDFSRLYCCTVWSAIGIIMSSARLSVCNTVHCGSRGQCDFLLVRHSNLAPILHRFRDIAGFCANDTTPIPPKFWGCSRFTSSPI